jgi:hypothetical protein
VDYLIEVSSMIAVESLGSVALGNYGFEFRTSEPHAQYPGMSQCERELIEHICALMKVPDQSVNIPFTMMI